MASQYPTNPRVKHLAKLLVILTVLLSFSVEMASTLVDTESETLVLEEFGSESDSEGKVDFENDTEGEKSQNRSHALCIDSHSAELLRAQVSNFGLSYALSPLQQLDAPPPEV